MLFPSKCRAQTCSSSLLQLLAQRLRNFLDRFVYLQLATSSGLRNYFLQSIFRHLKLAQRNSRTAVTFYIIIGASSHAPSNSTWPLTQCRLADLCLQIFCCFPSHCTSPDSISSNFATRFEHCTRNEQQNLSWAWWSAENFSFSFAALFSRKQWRDSSRVPLFSVSCTYFEAIRLCTVDRPTCMATNLLTIDVCCFNATRSFLQRLFFYYFYFHFMFFLFASDPLRPRAYRWSSPALFTHNLQARLMDAWWTLDV